MLRMWRDDDDDDYDELRKAAQVSEYVFVVTRRTSMFIVERPLDLDP